MNCAKCHKRIEPKQSYARTKRGPHHFKAEHCTLEPTHCPHLNFKAQVNVTRMTDNKDEVTVVGYTAEITINCLECGVPFEFIGVDAGMMPTKPMASPDAQELRAPIKPKGVKIMPAIPGFTMVAQ